MPDRYRRVYWDANVFLAYVNGEPDRLPVIDALLDESRRGNIIIVTSMVSMTEVAYATAEKLQQSLDPEVEEAINNLFADREVVRLSEYHELLAREARALIRDAVANGWKLTPMDAIHLATAKRLDVSEFHTYDQRLLKYEGPLDFPIHAPQTIAPRLPLEVAPAVPAVTPTPEESAHEEPAAALAEATTEVNAKTRGEIPEEPGVGGSQASRETEQPAAESEQNE